MNTDEARKTCKMCCMEIPKEARKCPYCHQFQNRLSLIMYHPATAVLVALIPMALLLTIYLTVAEKIFGKGESYETYQNQITISDSQLVLGDTKSGATVAIMGTIKNTSPVPWKDIRFHADFFDAAGKRSDAGQKEEYSFYLPANATTSFKISFRREFPESNYVKHAISVVVAKDARTRW